MSTDDAVQPVVDVVPISSISGMRITCEHKMNVE